ncbi:MAG: type I phosphomannose isomerase catalytic subunit [Cetobacterium sp.]|uniref:type I phosphomannose isomerase catalytic subunit n=1 Tax=Cetobacterium sp. TaxID=2071632 RepID=UPI003F335214
MDKIIFTEAIFFNRIWGGNRIIELFNLNATDTPIGEAWGISSHKTGDCNILSGIHQGKKLSEAIRLDSTILGKGFKKLPLQIRILDSKNDLSLQVHPNNNYAKINSNDFGKNEYWYILNCEKDAKLIYGHTFTTKKDFEEAIFKNEVMNNLNYLPIKEGDLVSVPTGLLHAMTKNITAIEVCDSSDVTYRVYDYNRVDAKGNKRELHIKDSLNTIDFPCKYPIIKTETIINNAFIKKILLNDEIFYITNIKNFGYSQLKKEHQYYACFVISGSGEINNSKIKAGDFFILTSLVENLELNGNFEILLSYSKNMGGF